jgi:SAM-dependent methyltransferase
MSFDTRKALRIRSPTVEPREYSALARVEREHWFYRGKRDLVRHWLNRLASLGRDDLLIDVGAGTGQLLLEFRGSCRAIGIEHSPHGLEYASQQPVELVRGSLDALPLAGDVASVVTALDVLEHVDDDERAFAELVRITRPRGLAIIHVPAFPMLWSDWDESLGHKRRYTVPSLIRLANRFPVTIRRCVYVNTAAFPPVLFYRWLRRSFPGLLDRRLEDTLPPAPLNRLLHGLFVGPACWSWLSPPFGISILCIIEKQVSSGTASKTSSSVRSS